MLVGITTTCADFAAPVESEKCWRSEEMSWNTVNNTLLDLLSGLYEHKITIMHVFLLFSEPLLV